MPLVAEQLFTGRQLDLVKLLERGKADEATKAFRGDPLLNAPTTSGVLPLTYLVGNENGAAIGLAVQLGADPERFVKGRGTPLSIAAKSRSPVALTALLDAGGDPNSVVGAPLIHVAGMASAYGNIRLLVERGADVNARPGNGDTLLVSALFQGDMDLALLSLDLGCDPRIPNKFGATAEGLAEKARKSVQVQEAGATEYGRRVEAVSSRIQQVLKTPPPR